MRGDHREQRIAVGLGFRDEFRSDITRRAASIVDHDLLLEDFGEFRRDDAHRDIRAAARHRRNDEAHGTFWVLGPDGSRRDCKREAQQERQEPVVK